MGRPSQALQQSIVEYDRLARTGTDRLEIRTVSGFQTDDEASDLPTAEGDADHGPDFDVEICRYRVPEAVVNGETRNVGDDPGDHPAAAWRAPTASVFSQLNCGRPKCPYTDVGSYSAARRPR